MILSLSSDTLPLDQVDNYADVILSQQISRIDGVGLVNIGGQQKPAVRIQIDPRKVAARGLQIDTVRQAIVAATVNAPKGTIVGTAAGTSPSMPTTRSSTPSRGMILSVGYQNGAPVRIKDIGDAIAERRERPDRRLGLSRQGQHRPDADGRPGHPAGHLQGARRQRHQDRRPDPRGAAAAAGRHPARHRHSHPRWTGPRPSAPRSADVKITLLITIVLVVIVIFLFLRNVRATLIPSAVIPLALLAAAAVMLALKFSLDNLSLMALTIAVGFVVDDAIVMVEVIWQRIEHGEKPFEAALAGAGEISFTILSISISLIAVFTPLMFMGGVVGPADAGVRRHAQRRGAGVAGAHADPDAHAVRASSSRNPSRPRTGSPRAWSSGFHRLENSYARALDIVLRHKLHHACWSSSPRWRPR